MILISSDKLVITKLGVGSTVQIESHHRHNIIVTHNGYREPMATYIREVDAKAELDNILSCWVKGLPTYTLGAEK